MKEIFDSMRKQINKTIYSIQLQNNHGVNFEAIDIADAENIITEAEAKWEEDCCEWTPNKYVGRMHYTSCGYASNYNANSDKYCKHCGKPIKIVEVE